VFEGSVFISDSNNNVIRRVLLDGTIETYAGAGMLGYSGDDGPRGAALFNRPGGIELDADGNLYVCDRYNSVIRVIASPAPGGLAVPIEPYHLPLPSRGNAPTWGASGTIDTYAGSGLLGFNGNGRPALGTDLYWPQDVTVDPANGLVYLLDWNNHRVRRVEAGGTVTTVIGSGQLGDTDGPAAEARLNHPTDLAFHPLTGELWVAAWHTDKILRLDSALNTVVYMAGGARNFTGDNGAPASATMNIPSSVKFDAAGNWYIGDEGNRRVRHVDATLNVITTLVGAGGSPTLLGDGGPAATANLNFPVGQSAQPGGRVCLSPDDRWLYVADTLNHRIRRVDLQHPQRIITTFVGTGVAGFAGDGGLATDARIDFPTDVDCDGAGNLYVVDQENDCVRRVDAATNVITTVIGTGGAEGYAGDGGLAKDAKLSRPSGIFVERTGPRAGRIYVADTYNGVVRVVWE
jgi:DNA-binding beta-propeller fold protein YncE